MKKTLVAAIIIKDGKMLLVHNVKHRSRWEPPGGKIEPGEDPEKAVKREAMEEIGCEVEVLSFFDELDSKSDEGEFSVKMYICKITSGEPKIPENEKEKISELSWKSFDEMETLKNDGTLAPNLTEALPRLREELKEIRPR